jgi:sucrose-6-phosphatase
MIRQLFICTDLDRTLLPNGSQSESPTARSIFAKLVERPEVTLAYISGRNRALVQAAIAEYQLPVPDWVVSDVGSTIDRVHERDRWEYSQSWEDEIGTDWQSLTASDLQPLFADLTALTLQAPEHQNSYKLSYHLPLCADVQAIQQSIELRLKQQNLAASAIYSVDEAAAIGLLDILPASATKLHAVEFLMRQQGFDYLNTVFAGDSGNDLPVLVSAVPAVLVANAHPEVIAQATAQTQASGSPATLYLARGGFLGMNGNYSAGILEGIAHYHPDTQLWMA